MNIVILDAKTIGEDIDLTVLEKFGKVITYATTDPCDTYERIRNATIVITNKVVISKLHMQRTPLLKLICVAATGMNNIDLEAAKQIGIAVKNVAGYSTKSVVQHTFAMAFYLLEKMRYYDTMVKDGSWSRSGLFTDVSQPFEEISGKTWGIVGLGTIGKEVAKVATAFGAKVQYHSTSGKNLEAAYQHVALNDLLLQSDIISIHAPLNETTQNLLRAENLALLKEDALLLNLGRGGIVNEADLANEMENRTIYAGLDVISTEPIEENNPLLHITAKERLLITPHIAWASKEARVKLVEGIVCNIETFLDTMKH